MLAADSNSIKAIVPSIRNVAPAKTSDLVRLAAFTSEIADTRSAQ
jgi:hypothetical protein